MTLDIENLSFAYGSNQVLKAIDLKGIKSGKLTAFIGPNAAGKSTLLKFKTGFIVLDGDNLEGLAHPERVRRICYMPQLFSANAAIERNIICIVALHDLNLAARFSDHVVLIRDGEIAATGDASTVLASEAVEETCQVKLDVIQSAAGQIHVSASL